MSQIPLEAQYWDAAAIASSLCVSADHFLRRIAPMPSFPKARRIPTTGGRGHPRWKATEVLEWVDSAAPTAPPNIREG